MRSGRAAVSMVAALAAALLGDCRADPPVHRCTVVLRDPALGGATGSADASTADDATSLARQRACEDLAERSPAFVDTRRACEQWRRDTIGGLSHDAALALEYVCRSSRTDGQPAPVPEGVPAELAPPSRRWLAALFDARQAATQLCVESTVISAASTCGRRTWIHDLAGGCGAALGN